MMKTAVKTWKLPIMPMIMLKKMIGEIIGIVTFMKRRQALAPSISAASCNFMGTPCRPARKDNHLEAGQPQAHNDQRRFGPDRLEQPVDRPQPKPAQHLVQHAIFSIRLPDPPLKIEDIGGIIGGEVGLDLLIVAARVLLHRNVYALGHVVIGVDYVFIDDRVLHIGPGREAQLNRLHTGRRLAAALAGRRCPRRRASRQHCSANGQRACLEKSAAADGVMLRIGH